MIDISNGSPLGRSWNSRYSKKDVTNGVHGWNSKLLRGLASCKVWKDAIALECLARGLEKEVSLSSKLSFNLPKRDWSCKRQKRTKVNWCAKEFCPGTISFRPIFNIKIYINCSHIGLFLLILANLLFQIHNINI